MKLEQMTREQLIAELKALLDKDKQEQEQAALLHDLRVHQVELELQNRNLRETQSALEESRARFEELYDFAPVACYTLDPAGNVQEANLTAARMVGRDRDQIIGVPFLELVKMRDPDRFWKHLRRCADERGRVVTDMRLSADGGEPFDVEAVSAPILDPAGLPIALRTSLVDISRLKQTEVELERARDQERSLRKRFEILDRISVSLGRRLVRNGVAEPPLEFFQEIADQARLACDAEYAALGIGSDPTRPFDRWVFSGVDPARAKKIGRFPSPAGLLGEVIRTGRSIRLRDLREHPRFRGFPAHHPEMQSFLGVVVPDGARAIGHLYLTNKRSAEEFSRDDQETIEMLAQRAGTVIEIARLTGEVRAAVAARDNVLAVVSHDLRGTLHALQLSADLLTEGSPIEDRRKNRKQVELIRRSSQRMTRLLDDLLDAATIEAGTFAIKPACEEVAPLVDQALALAEPLAINKNARLEQDVPSDLPSVHCDRERVMQVLSNLLGNAVKFVPAGGHVQVRARAGGNEILFAVSDNGPGIADAQREHLFDRYWTAKAAGRRGVGLGLYIAKGIVDAHGGRIWAESLPGAGTTLSFTIPIEPSRLR